LHNKYLGLFSVYNKAIAATQSFPYMNCFTGR
jgi:hypothetical protein